MTRPAKTKLCPIILLCNGFRSLCSSFQWGSALSTLGRISIHEYKTPQRKFLCSIAENFVEHNVRFTSCIFKVALHGYAGRPDWWLLPSSHPEIYFVALDADEGNVFLTSQKYHTHDDMMGLIDSLKWYLMGSLLIRLDGFLFIVLQLNIVILVADLTKIWTILMCI